jgi:hypothetical protein
MKNLLISLLIGAALTFAAGAQAKTPRGAHAAAYTAMDGYYGNTMVFWTPAGKVLALIYYNPDFTYREWRHGKWMHGTFVINNAQDSSILCLTRMEHDLPITNCHSFVQGRGKVVGDKWTNTPTAYERPKPGNQTGWLTLEKGHRPPPTR